MPTRTATTTWTGDLQTGSGTVEMTSSKVGTYEVSFPKRAADEADGTTSPEELDRRRAQLLLRHGVLQRAGPGRRQQRAAHVRADVTLSPDPAGGFRIRSSKLTVRGTATASTTTAFVKAAEAAKVGCPVSKALTGIEITLDAALD